MLIFDECWKSVQESTVGRGNIKLKSERKQWDVIKYHIFADPKDHDEISVISFYIPLMCNQYSVVKVRGHILFTFMCRTSAQIRNTAKSWCLKTICMTHTTTICMMSLNNASCFSCRDRHISTIANPISGTLLFWGLMFQKPAPIELRVVINCWTLSVWIAKFYLTMIMMMPTTPSIDEFTLSIKSRILHN